MAVFRYVIVVTGQVEAPSEDHAKLQAAMGISVSGRLLTSPFDIAVEIQPVPDPQPTDGKKPLVMEH